MEVKKYGKNEGGAEVSNYVPMGTFSICAPDHKRRYLKSSGFGPCIGLVLLSKDFKAGVLAHFMSKNGVSNSLEQIGTELELLKLSHKIYDWEAVVFLGGQRQLGQQTASVKVEEKTKAMDAPRSSGLSSLLMDSPKSSSKSNSSMFDVPFSSKKASMGTGLDLNISPVSMENAKKRADELVRFLNDVDPQFVEDGFSSCVFDVDGGRLILNHEKILGYNDSTALKTMEGAALSLARTQMG